MSVNFFKNGTLTKIARGLKDAAVTITNNLLATKPGTALDAVQGKVLDDKITEVNSSLNDVQTITPKLIGNIETGYVINVQIKNGACYVAGGIKITNNVNARQDIFSGLPIPKIQDIIRFAMVSNIAYGYGEVSATGVLSGATNTSGWVRFNFSYLVQ